MNTNPLKTASHRNLVSLNGVRSSIAIVFSSFVFASIASAADYYVATTGSNSYTTTQAQNSTTPWKTIQKAADNVQAGSTVHVAPGTYSTLTTISKSGNASAHITFISDTKWGAKVQGSSSEALIRVDGSYVDIKNFEITGTGTVAEGILVTGSYVRVIGNKIHGLTGSGVVTWNATYNFGNIDFLGNLVYDVGSSSLDHGIYVMHKGGSVSNNVVYNASGFGIHAWHAATDLTFSNNLVFGCGQSGLIIGSGDDPGGVVADNYVVVNNISMNNGHYGITEIGTTGTHNIYKNNLVYGNSQGGFSLQNGNTHQNTLTVDPKLVNFKLDGTGDYHLSSSSPAIQTGTTQGAPSNDFDGMARTGNPDIGAYEYVSSLIVNPPLNLHVVLQ